MNNRVRVDRGGQINSQGGDLRGAEIINGSRGGSVVTYGADLSDANNPVVDKGIKTGRFVMVDARNATITDCGEQAVDANHLSIITLNSAYLSNADSQALFSSTGSIANAAGRTMDNADSNDVFLQYGAPV